MKRTASARWEGSGKEGRGDLSTQSAVLNYTPYSFHSRFEDGAGTNPEELIAAAHAGCFSMKLSFVLAEQGFGSDSIYTKAELTFIAGEVKGIHLTTHVKASGGITPEQFQAAAEEARANCPISRLLNTEITLDAQLLGHAA
jgi:osmotically inducible protein OsmC